MLFPLLGLVYFLAFLPQDVLSVFQFISYSSIQQCGSFNVSFSGGIPPSALPLTLTVVPFNSTPLAFTIPQSAWDNSTASGTYVAFLPLREGVSLMASLDDASGNSAALSSEVIQIGTSNNSTCIPAAAKAAAPPTFRLLNNNVSQCSPFNVTHNTTSPDYSISVRAFIPTGLSSWLQNTSLHSSQGVDTYTFIMSIARGFQVALLFVDGQGNRQVSDLLSVTGDESSPTKCLEITSSTPTATPSASSLSRPAIIAIAVASSVIVIVILLLGIFFVRRERQKLANLRGNALNTVQNHGQFDEPGSTVSPPVHPFAPIARVPANRDLPVPSPRSSVFSPFIPSTLGLRSQSRSSRHASIRTKSTIGGPNSHPLVDLDIAGLLEVASVKHREAETETRRSSLSAIPPVPPPSLTPSPRADRLPSGWKRSHRDLDVPLSPLGSLSGVSPTARVPSVLTQDMRVAAPKTDDLSSQGTYSTSSRDAGARSRNKTPVPF
ncbi:hypothetical protein EI94DRAFT_1698570 [Lactarius quietus]|nr:hypothetical protein EI94DRAFT_1698570 [Lactarius quietus]